MTEDDAYHTGLSRARADLDRIDGELIGLLLARLRISAEIGRLRKSHGLREVGARDRGAEVLARYRDAGLTVAGAATVCLEPVGRAILERSTAVQRQILGHLDRESDG